MCVYVCVYFCYVDVALSFFSCIFDHFFVLWDQISSVGWWIDCAKIVDGLNVLTNNSSQKG